MTKDDYINSLSVEELRHVVSQFWEWGNWQDGAPCARDERYSCRHRDVENEEDPWEECRRIETQEGCWARYFVEQFRRSKEARK